MSIDPKDITFVIQGPLGTTLTAEPYKDGTHKRIMNASAPAQSIDHIRKALPESTIIISTWKGQDASDLSADKVIFNTDPGPTITRFNRQGKPEFENINRQIISITEGLKHVGTRYAVKLRSDNILQRFDWLSKLTEYIERDSTHSFFDQRVISSTLWAQECASGFKMPFFFSDFFHAGLTIDLIKLWDIPLFQDLAFNEAKKGKRQYENAPWPNLCVEQKLSLACFRKFMQINIKHKHDIFNGKKTLSDKLFVNNFIALDQEQLGLSIPDRLEYEGSMQANCYSNARWKQLSIEQGTTLQLTKRDIKSLAARNLVLREEKMRFAYKVWARLIKCYLIKPFI